MNHGSLPRWEGVRTPGYQYAVYYEQSPPFEMLHDLQADPDELVNLARDPAHAEQLDALRARLEAHKQSYPATPWLE